MEINLIYKCVYFNDLCGKSPTMISDEFWLLKETKKSFTYMSSDTTKREIKYSHYIFFKYEGHILISRRYYRKTPNAVSKILNIIVIVKYLSPYIVLDITNIKSEYCIACTIQLTYKKKNYYLGNIGIIYISI